jgi:hypothetical protein
MNVDGIVGQKRPAPDIVVVATICDADDGNTTDTADEGEDGRRAQRARLTVVDHRQEALVVTQTIQCCICSTYDASMGLTTCGHMICGACTSKVCATANTGTIRRNLPIAPTTPMPPHTSPHALVTPLPSRRPLEACPVCRADGAVRTWLPMHPDMTALWPIKCKHCSKPFASADIEAHINNFCEEAPQKWQCPCGDMLGPGARIRVFTDHVNTTCTFFRRDCVRQPRSGYDPVTPRSVRVPSELSATQGLAQRMFGCWICRAKSAHGRGVFAATAAVSKTLRTRFSEAWVLLCSECVGSMKLRADDVGRSELRPDQPCKIAQPFAINEACGITPRFPKVPTSFSKRVQCVLALHNVCAPMM